MKKTENLEEEEKLPINRGVELMLRNRNKIREEPKSFQIRFGKMVSLFKREMHICFDLSLDIRRKIF